MSRTDRSGTGEAGFTLVEMLVALAVFGIAALALLKLVGVGIASAGALDRALVAQIVAHNVLVETMSDPQPPALGTTDGVEANGGVAWRWTRSVTTPGDTRLARIDVAVFDPAGRPLARTTSLRSTARPSS